MDHPDNADERHLVSYRTMEIAVAVFFLIAGAVVIADSLRLGIAWRPNEGPAPGYFPFYIACAMSLASVVNLIRAIGMPAGDGQTMITHDGLKRMAAIFVPAVAFVAATAVIGIYVSAAIYIAAFMMVFGKFAWWQAAAVALGISIVNFMMFEVWFLVPLPKGPLEAALGY